jgi:hypothetical protein
MSKRDKSSEKLKRLEAQVKKAEEATEEQEQLLMKQIGKADKIHKTARQVLDVPGAIKEEIKARLKEEETRIAFHTAEREVQQALEHEGKAVPEKEKLYAENKLKIAEKRAKMWKETLGDKEKLEAQEKSSEDLFKAIKQEKREEREEEKFRADIKKVQEKIGLK